MKKLEQLFKDSKKELLDNWQGSESLWQKIAQRRARPFFVFQLAGLGSALIILIALFTFYHSSDEQDLFAQDDYFELFFDLNETESTETGIDYSQYI